MRKIFTISFPLFLLFIAIGKIWGQDEGDEEKTEIKFEHSQGVLAEEEPGWISEEYYKLITVGESELQQTHEYTKTVYVKGGEAKALVPYAYDSHYYNTYIRWFVYEDESEDISQYLNIEEDKFSSYYYKTDKGYIAKGKKSINGTTLGKVEFDAENIPNGGIKLAMEVSCQNENTISISDETKTFTELLWPTVIFSIFKILMLLWRR